MNGHKHAYTQSQTACLRQLIELETNGSLILQQGRQRRGYFLIPGRIGMQAITEEAFIGLALLVQQ